MKTKLYDLNGKEIKEIKLPLIFSEEIRPDLIKRAVLNLQSNRRQKYGATPRAGMEVSAKISKRRRDYRGVYGSGRSRIPRKVMVRRGTQFVYTGALVSGAIGGRRAHPPKSEKNFEKKLNIKENRKAIRSAIAATISTEYLMKRGSKIGKNYPLIIKDLETLTKTKDILNLLNMLGLKNELERSSKRSIRPGKGTLRGRKYKKPKGPLIVVAPGKENNKKIIDACKNIPGVDVSNVNSINVELLAPGAQPGRLTIWSEDSLIDMDKKRLFQNIKKIKNVVKDK